MTTCKGTTKDGQPCNNKVKENEDYCWIHKPQLIPQEENNVVQYDSKQQEAAPYSSTKRELLSTDNLIKALKWLRDTVIGGVVGNAVYDTLKENVKSANKPPTEKTQDTSFSKTPSPEEIPTPRSSSKPRSTPTPRSIIDQIRTGTKELKGANLKGSDLIYVQLEGANLERANLSEARLAYANLNHANLRYANLSNSSLRDTNLEGADLSYANLRHAIVTPVVKTGKGSI